MHRVCRVRVQSTQASGCKQIYPQRTVTHKHNKSHGSQRDVMHAYIPDDVIQ